MNQEHLIASANDRIRQVRSADFVVKLVDGYGKPIKHADVTIALTNHAFKFGSNGFNIRSLEDTAATGSLRGAFRRAPELCHAAVLLGRLRARAGADP